jgi:hypothetical protein
LFLFCCVYGRSLWRFIYWNYILSIIIWLVSSIFVHKLSFLNIWDILLLRLLRILSSRCKRQALNCLNFSLRLFLFSRNEILFFNRNILINFLFIILIIYNILIPIAIILIAPDWIRSYSSESLKTRNKWIVVTCNKIIILPLQLIIIVNRWWITWLCKAMQAIVIFIDSKLWGWIHYKLRNRTIWLKLRFVVLIFFQVVCHWSIIINSWYLRNIHLRNVIQCHVTQIQRYFLIIYNVPILTLTPWLGSEASLFIDFVT